YLAQVREVASAMKGYYLARTTPKGVASKAADLFLGRKAERFLQERTATVVDGLTDNPKLRSVFTAQWGYYGSPPSRSSFAMQALVVKHFMHGGYYPTGGSQEIARCLLKTVADAGGWTAIHADVEEITIEDGDATGVRLTDGRQVSAKRVVSAAGVSSTVQRLLPKQHRQAAWATTVEKLPSASAHVCLYLGFRGDIREAGCGSANKWFYEVWSSEAEAWDVSNPDALPDAPVLYTSFPSLKDPTHDPGPEQLHTGEVVTFVPWEAFEGWKDDQWRRRGEEYEAFKTKLHDHMLEQFLRHMPGLRDKIAYSELSTPVSTDHFVRPIAGSIYGLEPTPERFANPDLRPRSPVKNLFFAGSEVTSVGVIGAMMGGVLAATSAEPVGAVKFLRRL
ncbi:MAG: FAD-dependent oxidoreductase, partial [Myxococcota bacterium]